MLQTKGFHQPKLPAYIKYIKSIIGKIFLLVFKHVFFKRLCLLRDAAKSNLEGFEVFLNLLIFKINRPIMAVCNMQGKTDWYVLKSTNNKNNFCKKYVSYEL